jgi:predicted CxxxxCH...CXXCH cytochrome family protein
MKRLLSVTLGLALLVLVMPFDVGAGGISHNMTNNVSCPDCHNSSLPSNSATLNNNCLSCHGTSGSASHKLADTDQATTSHKWTGNVTAPAAGAQSPAGRALAQVVNDYTGNQLACVDCHNPHNNNNVDSNDFLRIANDKDQLCLDCHRSRDVKSQRVVPGTYPASHPVNITYSEAVAANAGGYNNPPLNANQGNPNSDLGARLTATSSVLLCSTCHSVHNAYSQSATPPVADSSGKLGDGNLLRTNPRGDKVASGSADKLNICTNCHAGKMNHNGSGQDVQCIDCHAAHVEYDPNDPTNTKGTNINLIRRNLPGTSNQILFRYAGDNREYKNDAGTGVCQGCHAVPSSIAQHASNDPKICNTCHTHNSAKGAFTASCDSCHGYPPSAAGPSFDPLHPNNANCSLCHNTDPSVHMNGVVDVSTKCDACHGNPPAYANGTSKANSHSTTGHLVGCNTCHAGTTSNGTTITGTALHMNGTYSLQAGAGTTFTYMYAATGGTCSNISCHGNNSATWGGAVACGGCHALPPATGAHLAHTDGTGAAYGSDANKSVAAKYRFSCGNCHPMDDSRHGNGLVDIELYNAAATGFKSNNPANAGRTGVGNATVCLNIYCHSSGQDAAVRTYTVTPAWGGTFTGNRCAGCHGDPPAYASGGAGSVGANSHYSQSWDNGQVVEGGHLVGLHFDNIKKDPADSLQPLFPKGGGFGSGAGHGDPSTSTTISCPTCHAATVNVPSMQSAPGTAFDCVACHGGQASAVIADKSRHVNGIRDVAFMTGDFRSRAQIKLANFTSVIKPLGWTRNNGYKAYDSYDSVPFSGSYNPGDKSCMTSCHLSQPVKWGDTNFNCFGCHADL